MGSHKQSVNFPQPIPALTIAYFVKIKTLHDEGKKKAARDDQKPLLETTHVDAARPNIVQKKARLGRDKIGKSWLEVLQI